MADNYTIWQSEVVAKNFLEGVRGAIPLAAEQIALLLNIVQANLSGVSNFLDLGCGDGILGRSILKQYPQARGVFLDFSETMLMAAEDKILSDREIEHKENIQFVIQDFGNPHWSDVLVFNSPFDVIVSGFSIHHQSNQRKREIYQEIYRLLKPGGIFLNLEHVASRALWSEQIFDEMFIDALENFHQDKSREEVAASYYSRNDQNANVLLDVEIQCTWLREIGFTDVDCWFKWLEIALFGGVRS